MNKVGSLIHFQNSHLIFASGMALCLTTPTFAANPVSGYVMEIQMTPAVCMFDPNASRKRECLEGYVLNITGLYPETSKRYCRTNSSAALSPIQSKVVASVMPNEAARVDLWKNVSGCVSMNVSQYFRYMTNLADHLNIPVVITRHESTNIQQSLLRSMFVRLNPDLPTTGIEFKCKNNKGVSYLTHVKICYNNVGKYKSCSNKVENQCPKSFVIKGSY